jgi:hypothetical protein
MTRLDEIEARAAAATPGPWVGDEFEMTAPKAPTFQAGNVKLVWADDYHMNEWDAEFIKHAREDIPWLLAKLKECEAALEYYAQKPSPFIVPDELWEQGLRVQDRARAALKALKEGA